MATETKIGINKNSSLKEIGFNYLGFTENLKRNFKGINISSFKLKNSFEDRNIIEDLRKEYLSNSIKKDHIFAINCLSFLRISEINEFLNFIQNDIK